MTWQRVARFVVAAIGIGCAVAIALYARRREPPPPQPPALSKVDPNITLEAGAGQRQQYRAGKSPITTDYSNMRRYEDGRAHFEDAVTNGLDEQRYTIRAKVLEASAPVAGTERPARLNFSGGVKLTTDDGLDLLSDTATWIDATSQLTMPGKVTFKKGRLSGSSDGADYDRVRDAFTLVQHAAAHVDADADGKGSMDLTSAHMTLFRGQHVVHLQENARIVSTDQTLTANTATLSFTDDEKAVKYLELLGSGRVTPNATAGASNRPAMNADKISMSFYEDGMTLKHATLTGQSVLTLNGETARTIRASRIDLSTAPDGQTLTDLNASDKVIVTIPATADSPGRTITSSLMTAKGDPKKGLTSAQFDGNPVFEETPAAPPARRGGGPQPAAKPVRKGTSVVLVLKLNGQIDAIDKAEFRQKAEFRDTDTNTVGLADIAEFEDATGMLHLRQTPKESRGLPRVETPDMTVDAVTIDVNTQTNDLNAQGTITTSSKPATGGTAPPGALFSGDGPIIGSADRLVYTKSTSTAVYTGTPKSPARLKQMQSQSEVSGNTIEYTDTSRNLKARGNVSSTWQFESEASKPGATEQKTQTVSADTLVYDDAARTAVYTGNPVDVTSTDGHVNGKTVTFRLEDDSSELRSMKAVTAVWANLSGNYEGSGDVLFYEAKNDTYTLDGRQGAPAKVKSPPDNNNPTCKLNTGMRVVLNRNTNQVTQPGEGQAPQAVAQVPCTMSLRPPK